MFDLRKYWPLWGLAALSMLALAGVSTWQFKRSNHRKPRAPEKSHAKTLVSAHRGGVGTNVGLENTREGLEAALALDCEYVEFDVQRLGDGFLVVSHDDKLVFEGVEHCLEDLDRAEFEQYATNPLAYEEALSLLAGEKRAHIDLKFCSPSDLRVNCDECWEVQAAQTAFEILGEGNFIVTTVEDVSVEVLRKWSRRRHPWLLVGLSLGRGVGGMKVGRAIRQRLSDLFPARRVRKSGANLIVAKKNLARLTLFRFASRRELPLLVWTVDKSTELAYWMLRKQAWMVTTNVPKLAVAIRDASE
jgi:glycerophosphoryl diester phosphodiesterase